MLAFLLSLILNVFSWMIASIDIHLILKQQKKNLSISNCVFSFELISSR